MRNTYEKWGKLVCVYTYIHIFVKKKKKRKKKKKKKRKKESKQTNVQAKTFFLFYNRKKHDFVKVKKS